jgi:ferrochelatase
MKTTSSEMQTAVLLVNLGTPRAPTFLGVAQFLREFLSDPRVVNLPRWLWWFILHGLVLPFRSSRVAKLYQTIWMPEGSPLKAHMERLTGDLREYISRQLGEEIPVMYAMTYGEPGINTLLKLVENKAINRLIVLPLFPQYSATTTAAVFDKLALYFKKRRYVPTLYFINEYTQEPLYHQAIADSILKCWSNEGQTECLLFSFHGLPVRYEKGGDPYPARCRALAEAVAKRLNISEGGWKIGFQSRFGFDEWVKPYSDQQLVLMAEEGVRSVTVVSPSFSVDCLETLEELNIQHRQIFLKAGGEIFHYVPALNNSSAHLKVLFALIQKFF